MGSVERMVARAVGIANDDSHGYSWADRWNTDRDCSSLMYDSADAGGFPVGRGPDRARYTGTMLADFTAAGFEAIPFREVGLGGLRRGDVLLNVEHHTEMYIGGGQMVGAHIAETGGVYGQPGDQTGNEISVGAAYVYWDGWDYVLRPHDDGGEEEDEMKVEELMDYRMTGDNGYEASFRERITRMDDKSQEALDTAKASEERLRKLNARVRNTNALLRETNALLRELAGRR